MSLCERDFSLASCKESFPVKRMLINATELEEVRVALVDGQKLYDLDIESPQHANKKANIYKGRITRVEPSLEAAFVDYGMERHGFLPIKEIAREYYPEGTNFSDHNNLKNLIREGQEVIVQIEKEERGQKGAALTTYISLAGSYLVLMPNNPRAGGISRRIEGEERAELKAALEGINIPHGMGVIVRTAGVGKSSEELAWDLSILTKLWEMIRNAASARPAPFLIHQESSIALRAIRDYLRPDIGEILVDDRHVYDQIRHYVEMVRPEFTQRVRLYTGDIPLFSKFQIESQIESAYQREVRLPSGGAIVIDPTEALTSIDVNSARATKGGDIEETALQTNIEAAEEIARQLRLRDIGGLIVIDFIDMTPLKNQREIENRMREAVRQDRARIQFSRISRFGLLEMSRQRLRPSLEESSAHVCPMCQGQGTVRDTSSLALSVLRLVEEEAHKNTGDVFAVAPVEVATFILNEKRRQVADIEKRHHIKVSIIPDQHMMAPQFEVQRLIGGSQPGFYDSSTSVLEERTRLARKQMQESIARSQAEKSDLTPARAAEPAIDPDIITSMAPRPPVSETKKPAKKKEVKGGLLSRIVAFFKGGASGEEEKKEGERERKSAGRNGRRPTSRRPNNRRNGRYSERYEDSRRREKNERSEKKDFAEKNERSERSAETQERAERPVRETNRKERPARSRTPRTETPAADSTEVSPRRRPPRRSEMGEERSARTRRPRMPREEGPDENLLTGEAPRSIARAQAEARREDEARHPELFTPRAPEVYKPRKVEFISAPMGEGEEFNVSFAGTTQGRNPEEGNPYEYSSQAGGFSSVRNVAEIEGISEPASLAPDFGGSVRMREYAAGSLETAARAGGYSAARNLSYTAMLSTQNPVGSYDDDVRTSFNDSEESAPDVPETTVDRAAGAELFTEDVAVYDPVIDAVEAESAEGSENTPYASEKPKRQRRAPRERAPREAQANGRKPRQNRKPRQVKPRPEESSPYGQLPSENEERKLQEAFARDMLLNESEEHRVYGASPYGDTPAREESYAQSDAVESPYGTPSQADEILSHEIDDRDEVDFPRRESLSEDEEPAGVVVTTSEETEKPPRPRRFRRDSDVSLDDED